MCWPGNIKMTIYGIFISSYDLIVLNISWGFSSIEIMDVYTLLCKSCLIEEKTSDELYGHV